MAFTLTTLQTEFAARGFDYLSTTRQNYFINRAYMRVCERYPWPFLEANSTGTAPLTISDLRAVLSVTNTTTDDVLPFRDKRTLREMDPSLDDTGAPECWYLNSQTAITVWPVRADSLSVDYIKFPTLLSAGTDTLLIPARYEYLVVDGACWLAYRDSDNQEMADSCWQAFDDAIEEMAESLLVPNYDSTTEILTRGGYDW